MFRALGHTQWFMRNVAGIQLGTAKVPSEPTETKKPLGQGVVWCLLPRKRLNFAGLLLPLPFACLPNFRPGMLDDFVVVTLTRPGPLSVRLKPDPRGLVILNNFDALPDDAHTSCPRLGPLESVGNVLPGDALVSLVHDMCNLSGHTKLFEISGLREYCPRISSVLCHSRKRIEFSASRLWLWPTSPAPCLVLRLQVSVNREVLLGRPFSECVRCIKEACSSE